ncbi:LysR family transcriptional regulator [Streptomyces sp. HC44]|uniref:LysR family transcriptional regulator n=1 Tax=Streptomyces scabichelini TaxID=2711217 RepID=A0A6G4VAK2_9ACTN|nr:LysR family transcriptional regulator [Streptomyces scabichelini]NGO11001.1 LysR family transcriptional regulator [Streptomyces scabichelini]
MKNRTPDTVETAPDTVDTVQTAPDAGEFAPSTGATAADADEIATRAGRQLPAHADLNLLRTFLAVYRTGTFTAAAPTLGLSQPTVTAQIRALEQQTGRELFTRLPRGVEPTHLAHELAAQIAGPLDALAALEGGGPSAGHTAPVHLAGPSELLCVRVLPALVPLVAEGVELRVTQGLPEPLLDEMRAGRHDLVITTRRPRGRTLDSVPLTDEEYVLVAAPAWARRIGGDVQADDLCAALRGIPLVTYAEDLPIVRRYWRTVLGKQLTSRAAVTVPNLYAVLSAVNAGAGFSVLPRSLCQDHLDSGRLTVLHEPGEPPLNTLFLVQRPGAETNPDVVRVRNTLQHAARDW